MIPICFSFNIIILYKRTKYKDTYCWHNIETSVFSYFAYDLFYLLTNFPAGFEYNGLKEIVGCLRLFASNLQRCQLGIFECYTRHWRGK